MRNTTQKSAIPITTQASPVKAAARESFFSFLRKRHGLCDSGRGMFLFRWLFLYRVRKFYGTDHTQNKICNDQTFSRDAECKRGMIDEERENAECHAKIADDGCIQRRGLPIGNNAAIVCFCKHNDVGKIDRSSDHECVKINLIPVKKDPKGNIGEVPCQIHNGGDDRRGKGDGVERDTA